jgi:type IV pilus assembly protein PilV
MNRSRNSGFSMIEVLVTIAILVVGLLGLVGLQVRATTMELESYQRTQALILLQEITDRLSINKANAASYIASNVGASAAVQACATLSGAAKDLCEWNNALVGAAEKTGGRNIGAMIGARGCITSPSANLYVITVAWQGLTPTVAPVEPCGSGSYGDDRQRRTATIVVRVATLSAT